MMTYPSSTLAPRVAAELGDRSVELSASWRRRTRMGATHVATADAGAQAEDVPSRSGEPDGGAALVCSIARALADQVTWRDEVMRGGWQMGTDAHAREGSLHYLLRAFDILGDVLLRAASESLERLGEGSPADGIDIARRLTGAVSLLRVAATRGYLQAMTDSLRTRFRTIRHDIRNPLGTIRSAVALMDDETLPPETRASPRVRAMVARNARSIDEMLRTTLGDSAAALPALSDQPATLRAIACAVRNELAQEAARQGIDIVVGDSLPASLVDSSSIELALSSVILAMMRCGSGPAELLMELAEADDERAAIAVRWSQGAGPAPSTESLSFARELSERSGGSVWVAEDGRVFVRVPLASPANTTPDPRPARSAREERHDGGGARQRPDLEAGTL